MDSELLSGYLDPNSSRIVTSSVSCMYYDMLKVQLIKYFKHILQYCL